MMDVQQNYRITHEIIAKMMPPILLYLAYLLLYLPLVLSEQGML